MSETMSGRIRINGGGSWSAPQYKAGDIIGWDTWAGTTYALIEWITPHGTCGLKATDGYSDFHERIPRGAYIVTTPVTFAPDRPIAYE